MSAEPKDLLLKSYQYWGLYLHQTQDYLGRCVAWCKKEAEDVAIDLSPEEQQELFVVLREARTAINSAFQPDRFNYAFLGNKTPHLHGHIVPRYKQAKVFNGVEFTDKKYGSNYSTNHDFKIPQETLFAIRDLLKSKLQ